MTKNQALDIGVIGHFLGQLEIRIIRLILHIVN